jgi:hypothetical protein
MSMMCLQSPILYSAIPIYEKGLDWNLVFERFSFVIGKNPGLENKISLVDERAPDLATAISDHPAF